MRKIKVAQIGMSRYSHGLEVFKTLQKLDDLYEIVGYVLPEGEREKFPENMHVFDGYREMTVTEILDDPEIDAVLVETEEIYLTKYARMVAKAGKHLHMEKPGGQNLAAFEALIDQMRSSGAVFHVGYMYRYNPIIREAIDKAQRGELGEILAVEAQMNCCHPDVARAWMTTFRGGMMFFLGCHMIDLVLQVQGLPKRVHPFIKRTGKNGVESEDFGMAVLEYERGVSFAKTTDTEMAGFVRRQLVISGTKGTIEIRPLELPIPQRQYAMYARSKCSDTDSPSLDFVQTEEFDRYVTMMEAFAAMVRGEIQNPISLDYELALYRTVLQACGILTDVCETEESYESNIGK